MREREVLDVYNSGYAAGYEARFLTEWRKPHTDFEIETLGRLMPAHEPWLDVACGTGYYLSQFPDAAREGLDLSPDMLARARRANPGVTFHEGSFFEPRPEWTDRWGLVSCLGNAYVVVQTMEQIRTVIGNLARWTSPTGACFLPLTPCDGLQGASIPYDTPALHPGRIIITGVTWTYVEESGERHEALIAPQAQYLTEQFLRYFHEVESLVYPRLRPEWEPVQRALVARRKRT